MRPLLVLALVACGGPTDDPSDDTDVVDTDDTDDTGADVDADCSDDVPTSGTALWGQVTDADGVGLARTEARVQYCRGTTCLFPVCHDSEGRYVFGEVAPGVGSYLVKPLGDAARFAVFYPLTLGDSPVERVTALPDRGDLVPVPSMRAELEIAEGVFLTVGAGDLPSDVGQPEPTGVAALDVTDVGLPLEGLSGTVEAVFLLAPFQEKGGDTDLGVRFEDGWSLGNAGRLWMGAYDTSSWVDLGALVPSEGSVSVDAGPDRLSTLVITREPVMMAR